MSKRRTVNIAALAIFGGSLALLGLACGGGDGVPKADYDKVQQQLADKEAEATQLEQQVADLQKKTAVTPDTKGALIGAKVVTPAPTATPLPAGTTPAPAPARETPPPSTYEKAGDFYIYAETLVTTTASKYNVAGTISCTPSGAFARGQRIVFRYDIVDLNTGIRLNDKDGSVVKVVMPNGDESAGRFSQRGGGRTPGAPFMFSSNWDIPLDYPLGGIDYKIVITTKDGKTMTWKPPALTNADIDTRPKVVQ